MSKVLSDTFRRMALAHLNAAVWWEDFAVIEDRVDSFLSWARHHIPECHDQADAWIALWLKENRQHVIDTYGPLYHPRRPGDADGGDGGQERL